LRVSPAHLTLLAMSRRLPAISLFCAWLCASGAMLDVTQAVAWTRMFAGYARSESVVSAVKDTFDPGRPCALCRAVGRAREASNQHGPAVPSAGGDRMILISERPDRFVVVRDEKLWPEARCSRVPNRTGDVPVPPPKSQLA
jgi:hypothetical protein